MSGINRAIIVGRLGTDPELRLIAGTDSRVCRLSVATSRVWRDDRGEKRERTQWHRIELWNRRADIAAKYLTVGDWVGIEGAIEYDRYEKDGVERWATKIRATELNLIGGNRQTAPAETAGNYSSYQSEVDRSSAPPAPEPPPDPNLEPGPGPEDDDLPF